MTRLPIDQRRRQLVRAALVVATREGLDRTTMRAIAAEADVALGVLHYCFTDKAEILRAVAEHIHTAGLDVALAAAGHQPPDRLVASVVEAYVAMVVVAPRQYQLELELAMASLRDPELAGLAADRQTTKLANARSVLDAVADGVGLVWTVPVDVLARRLTLETDGAVLAWLIDRDDEALATALHDTAGRLRALGRPAPRP
ncbi:MAG: TetR family transcriptional regulator [Cellulomonas sp.]|nr:TetR family transcriptional regulator [Actinomycetota bacterium]MCG2796908.1 TetR family transcriptional regulator [Cellulomonas sp.]